MRNTDERMLAAIRRSEELITTEKRRNSMIHTVSSVAGALICVCIFAFCVPMINMQTMNTGLMMGQDQMAASIFAQGNALGYLLVGIFAYILGSSITVLSFYLHKKDKEEDRDEH